MVVPSTIPAYSWTASLPGTLNFPHFALLLTCNPNATAIWVSITVLWAPVSTMQYINFPFIPKWPMYYDLSHCKVYLLSSNFLAQLGSSGWEPEWLFTPKLPINSASWAALSLPRIFAAASLNLFRFESTAMGTTPGFPAATPPAWGCMPNSISFPVISCRLS